MKNYIVWIVILFVNCTFFLGCLGNVSNPVVDNRVENTKDAEESQAVATKRLGKIIAHPVAVALAALLGTTVSTGVSAKGLYKYSRWFRNKVDFQRGALLWLLHRPLYEDMRETEEIAAREAREATEEEYLADILEEYGQEGVDAWRGEGFLSFLLPGQLATTLLPEQLATALLHEQRAAEISAKHGPKGLEVFMRNKKEAVDIWNTYGSAGFELLLRHEEAVIDVFKSYHDEGFQAFLAEENRIFDIWSNEEHYGREGYFGVGVYLRYGGDGLKALYDGDMEGLIEYVAALYKGARR